ncbi:FIG056164: rhomboid family serine protease [hydrothermal vent metagenome]|uniref:FIG056164: rhomboid family serine protease n=1 Tax=hydrothermal vent metagenome TaxID=652676 RepID=A0A3B0VWH4_9ZZZZ
MIPIGDDNRDRTITPYVNYVLIALNLIVFIIFQGMGENLKFTYAFSTVPQEIVSGEDLVTENQVFQDPASGQEIIFPGLQPTPISVYLTLLTAMFMHGGWAHIGGNMLYLWIFGDNLEDRMGHLRYLLFYLLCGLLASLAHVFATVLIGDNLQIPSLGASGAIAGVLGGYLLLFPRNRVTVILVRVVTQVRAIFAVGVWFVLQLVGGLGTLSGGSDGVAYAAHIGGFIAGLALVKLFAAGRSE